MSALTSHYGRFARIMNRAVASVSYRLHVATANLWRDSYNPLRSLTITRAVMLLEEGERGAYADLQWTYRYIEMQDATLGALIERRTSAIQKLDWGIKVVADLTDDKKAIAERQEAALKDAYGKIGNFSAALEFLALRNFRGFSHLEKVEDENGDVIELAPVDQWFWVREGLYGQWTMNRDSKIGVTRGELVPLPRFIIAEASRPINRVALIAFIRKNLSQKDWDAFIETFGVPAVFVIMPKDVPNGKEEDYLDAADQVTSDARGVLPYGSDIKTVDNGARGVNPFKEHLAYQDEQIVMRGTGGKLTMLSDATGIGGGASDNHEETFEAIAKADAAEISEILRKQFDRDIIERVTPGYPAYAYFELAANEETDTKAIVEDVKGLKDAGHEVDPTWIEEKTGYKLLKVATPDQGGEPMRIVNRDGSSETITWKKFPRETGTLNVPRSIMPQVRNGSRGAMVNFLAARGVGFDLKQIKPSDLKPTQAEYSPEKVAKSATYQGKRRALLVSSDHHVIDGHHQYMDALQASPNTPIEVMQLRTPIMHALGVLLMMPSTTQEETIRNRAVTDDAESEDLQAIRSGLTANLRPLGEAMWKAYQAGDYFATRAALKQLSKKIPDLTEDTSAISEPLARLMAKAWTPTLETSDA